MERRRRALIGCVAARSGINSSRGTESGAADSRLEVGWDARRGGGMTVTRSMGQGIPRLQELGFLLRGAREVARGGTFEQIRRGLIEQMTGRALENTPSGNSARHRIADEKPG